MQRDSDNRLDAEFENDALPNRTMNQELDLFAVVRVALRHWRMILRNLVIAVVFFLLVALIWPPSYSARTTLLPPDAQDSDDLVNLLNRSPIVRFAVPSARSSSELFVEILESRTVGSGVLNHPLLVDSVHTTLMRLWGIASEEKALKRLYDHTTFATSEQGIIEIIVEMGSPELAAGVANAFVAELDRVNQEKSVSAARSSRQYIESQLDSTSRILQQLADSLQQFQTQYGAVRLDEQMRAVFEQAGELKGNLIAKKVELEMMRRSMKSNNPALAQMQAEIAAIEKQYQRLQYGTLTNTDGEPEFLIPFSEVPALGRRLAELTRELKVQETVWELLNQQYYQAKIHEARDTPTVQVLDAAVPPESRSKPRRLLLVVIGTMAVLILSVIAAFILDYVQRLDQNGEERARWRRLLIDRTGARWWR